MPSILLSGPAGAGKRPGRFKLAPLRYGEGTYENRNPILSSCASKPRPKARALAAWSGPSCTTASGLATARRSFSQAPLHWPADGIGLA